MPSGAMTLTTSNPATGLSAALIGFVFRCARRGIPLLTAMVVVVVLLGGASSAATPVSQAACANAIVCENALLGNPPGEWDVAGLGTGNISGFGTDISVNVGGTISFKVDTPAT